VEEEEEYFTDSDDAESVEEVNPNEVRRTRTREVKLPDRYKDYVLK